MNKTISSSILLIAGAMMISSSVNAQGITIEKRHYKGGYYIDFGKKKTESKANVASENKQNVAVISVNSNASIPAVNAEPTEQMQLVTVTNVPVKREKSKHAVVHNVVAAKANVASAKTESKIEAIASEDSVTAVTKTENSSNSAGMPLLLLVIITILIPFLGVGLAKGVHTQFWIDLILTLLFYFPGLIYGLIVILGNS